ncbi:two-component sensor histidine kinase [Hydrogenophaga taeniospiralis]|uniref:sensor histidine kinase n=1 Tax=Hydrogenophaga taeniospiralis TaxID=65656 RepID=UPI001CFA11B4|nr:histidine kinase dimerization/phospho-acceptor domain-containing protein [Hydrogenophaga taeniospiralis]MCB4362523.1 two-component sensor histidine kinase [Hydrogenophaga taeniospiralis]
MNLASTPRPARQPVLRRYILSWTLGALLVVWLTLIAVAAATGFRETRKFSDGQLVAMARLWLEAAPTGTTRNSIPESAGVDHEYMQDVAVLAWENGRLVADTHRMAPGLNLSRLPLHGFSTVTLQTEHGVGEWRSYGVQLNVGGRQRRVLALMDMDKRFELGKDIAKHVAQPAILVLPLVALVLWWTIRRGLRPLDRLSSEVEALDGFAGQRLDTQHRFREFFSTVAAINTLVDTLQTRAQREREFASDVAHELRTPLSAIALQASAAQHGASREQLAQLEQEALRAGRILSQLLDLARAQRTGADGPGGVVAQSVALGAVASDLISRHAQLGYETDHELSLVQPATAVEVVVPPMLLELALRNLIENALRHTPRGTQVCVEVWQTPQAVGVSVSDDGQRGGPPPLDTSPPGGARLAPADTSGLGLGLRLVERIAEQMGAGFERDAGQSPMTTRFTLRWKR